MSTPDSFDDKLAIALSYDGYNTPLITAKGHGQIADDIIKLANDNDVFLHEDKALIRVLSGLELGDEIPEGLYWIIAEVIAFAYMAAGKRPGEVDITG